ncbi:MAG: TlyA family RNA methyltransferase [Bacillota bacterium]|nr:TlyA family RNA methyltransferase [Bacillota bacterium]
MAGADDAVEKVSVPGGYEALDREETGKAAGARPERRAETRARLDVLLVEHGLFETREKARRAVMAGEVLVDGVREDKPGTRVSRSATIELRPSREPYVSRGGEKLEKALDEFGVDVSGKAAIDVGASTGGFTDCLLRRGARRVYAVDVGYGQLAWELRSNPKVVVLERTNVRYLEPGAVPEQADICTIDVSFISIMKFLEHLLTFLSPGAAVVALVKPQFEAGREKVGKGGVVRDPEVHAETLLRVIEFMERCDLEIRGLTYSPIKGPAGNIEFLVYAVKGQQGGAAAAIEAVERRVREVVGAAHRALD